MKMNEINCRVCTVFFALLLANCGGSSLSTNPEDGGPSGGDGASSFGDASGAGTGGTGGTGGSTGAQVDAGDAAGGTDGSADSGTEAGEGMDGAAGSGGSEDAGETDGAEDAGVDSGMPGCGADDTACILANNIKGFCRDDKCTACSGEADNDSCSAAYGKGKGYVCDSGDCVAGNCLDKGDCAAGKLCGVTEENRCGDCTADSECSNEDDGYGDGYLCGDGTCVQGDCKNDGDCSDGKICGIDTAYNCGDCTSDSQCQSDTDTYGLEYICNTADNGHKGECVSYGCETNNQACGANPADFCCDNSCVAGNCCDNADCASLGNNYLCEENTCVVCPLATSNTYYVDPVNGDDTLGTGNTYFVECAFKTITRALSVIGTSPNPGTKVYVLTTGPIGVDTNGETFPIAVPQNVTISGSDGRAQIVVPADTNGFVLSKTASALANLDIDGQEHTAATAISVETGSDAAISQVAIHDFAQSGIHVTGHGVLDIGQGVSSKKNGVAGNVATLADGLLVDGEAAVTINVTSGDPVHFDDNRGNGINVQETASIALNGTPGTGGNGTITTNNNGATGTILDRGAGLRIEQTAGTVPVNNVTGLVSWANDGHGMHIFDGSAIKLRDSYVLANTYNGIYVTSTASTPDISKVDLGTGGNSPDYGGNTVQASLGSNPNAGAGICLGLLNLSAGATLNAAGNIFAGPTDCSTSTATLTTSNDCSSADISLLTYGVGTTNTIDVSKCQ